MVAEQEFTSQELAEVVQGGIFVHPHSQPMRVLSRLFQASRHLQAVRGRLISLKQALQLVGGSTIESRVMEDAQDVIRLRQAIWDCARGADESIAAWMKQAYNEVVWVDIATKVQEWLDTLAEFSEQLPNDQVVEGVRARVTKFHQLITCLKPMYKPEVTLDHWMYLFAALTLDLKLKPPVPTVRKLQVDADLT
jgi:hypothetical protein